MGRQGCRPVNSSSKPSVFCGNRFPLGFESVRLNLGPMVKCGAACQVAVIDGASEPMRPSATERKVKVMSRTDLKTKAMIAGTITASYALAAALAVAVPSLAAAETASGTGNATGSAASNGGSMTASSTAGTSTAAQIQMVEVRGEAAVLAELEARGYEIVSRSRTLLGRVRIRAATESHIREVVLHQSTGEILRDAIVAVLNVEGNLATGTQQSTTGAAGVTGTLSLPEASVEAGAEVEAGVEVETGGTGSVEAGGTGGLGVELGN